MAVAPTTRKGQRTRERILSAARQVFARHGYVDAPMIAVAHTAGISAGGLYRYFENKEDLFAALIADLHEELYEASRAHGHDLKFEPFEALYAANRGYLAHYYENRDLMRTFIEAASVYTRFREIWWNMRRRHVDRFVAVLEKAFSVTQIDGVPAEIAADAMACMVEQCGYVWYAHDELNPRPVSVDEAAKAVTIPWYRTFFQGQPPADGRRDMSPDQL